MNIKLDLDRFLEKGKDFIKLTKLGNRLFIKEDEEIRHVIISYDEYKKIHEKLGDDEFLNLGFFPKTTDKDYILKQLDLIGMDNFINYYYKVKNKDLKEIEGLGKEKVNKIEEIFDKGIELEVLEYIMNYSLLDEKTRNKAKDIFLEEVRSFAKI